MCGCDLGVTPADWLATLDQVLAERAEVLAEVAGEEPAPRDPELAGAILGADDLRLANLPDAIDRHIADPPHARRARAFALARQIAADHLARGNYEDWASVHVDFANDRREHGDLAGIDLANGPARLSTGRWGAVCGGELGSVDEFGRCAARFHDDSCHTVTESAAATGSADAARAWRDVLGSRAFTRTAAGTPIRDHLMGNTSKVHRFGNPEARTGEAMPELIIEAARRIGERMGLPARSNPDAIRAQGQRNRDRQAARTDIPSASGSSL